MTALVPAGGPLSATEVVSESQSLLNKLMSALNECELGIPYRL
jgi:hypothetical protein